MTFQLAMSMAISAFILFACERTGKNEWEDLDYSKIHRYRENDAGYTAPSVLNCVDDDLYNCR